MEPLRRLLPPWLNQLNRLYESLKRALPEDFVDKTTDEVVKRIKSLTVPEFKNKENKIKYEANDNIMDRKIDEAISAIEKGKIERC